MLTVIGAGLPRTGTSTLRQALTELLGQPCHHMTAVAADPETNIPAFTKAAQNHPVNWDNIYSNYAAAVDWPTSAFWPELTAHYPQALVILSVRDTPQDWARSMSDTIIPTILNPQNRDHEPPGFDRMVNLIWKRALGITPQADPKDLAEAYTAHCQAVRHHIDPARLLEWNARQGWQPLCDALQLPVPNKPFPHLNTTADFNRDH
ncbi:sulfotransferase family protein [Natronoglycomyces albus]|uniref:Sulfotransferase family protein n=1 Tax=Natronoglycomyces albus TaxID=2811108 RepID=A0A895XN61_9ACTN|nr:sulfotransferase family protein [Natronoglycomyces albus]QSB06794.1 hypothetical protein JQS30_07875 [Natronoglycomyces albus]